VDLLVELTRTRRGPDAGSRTFNLQTAGSRGRKSYITLRKLRTEVVVLFPALKCTYDTEHEQKYKNRVQFIAYARGDFFIFFFSSFFFLIFHFFIFFFSK